MFGLDAWVIVSLFIGIVCAVISYKAAHKKGRSAGLWAFFTFFFPILVIFPLMLVPIGKVAEAQGKVRCPYCKEWVQPDAKICRFCHKKIL